MPSPYASLLSNPHFLPGRLLLGTSSGILAGGLLLNGFLLLPQPDAAFALDLKIASTSTESVHKHIVDHGPTHTVSNPSEAKKNMPIRPPLAKVGLHPALQQSGPKTAPLSIATLVKPAIKSSPVITPSHKKARSASDGHPSLLKKEEAKATTHKLSTDKSKATKALPTKSTSMAIVLAPYHSHIPEPLQKTEETSKAKENKKEEKGKIAQDKIHETQESSPEKPALRPPFIKSPQVNTASAENTTPLEMVSLVNGGVTASLQEINVKLDRPTLIGLVEKQNLDLRIADSRVEQAKGSYFGSYGNLMPSIRGQLYVERYNGGTIFIQAQPVEVKRLTYRPRLSLDYQLPLGGKPIFQIRAAKFRLDSQDHNRDQILQNALYTVMTQYYEMIRNRMSRVVTEQSLASMELLVKVNESKLKAGFGTRYEIEQARVQLAERQDRVLAARNEAATASIALASTLNLPVSSEFTPDVDALTPIRFIDPQMPMSHFLAKADISRPELKQLTAEIRAARAAYQATFSDLLPTFGITSYIGSVGQRTDQLRPIYQRGISLDFDVLKNMGVNTVGNIKTARSKLAETIAEREKRVNEIHQKLAGAYLDCQRYAQQIHVMKQKADAAEEAYRLAMARFKTGFSIQLEVLQAQTDYTNAIQEIQTAILNYNTTQLRLLLEAGHLTPEAILLGEEQPDFFSHKPDLMGNPKQALHSDNPGAQKHSAL